MEYISYEESIIELENNKKLVTIRGFLRKDNEVFLKIIKPDAIIG
jgi:hypothetical protein